MRALLARRRSSGLPLTAVIPFMIGIVSVTAATAGWQAARLEQKGTDRDRQVISEAAFLQRRDNAVETQLQSEAEAFARYRALIVAADRLAEDADTLRRQGFVDQARRGRERVRPAQPAGRQPCRPQL